MMKKIVLGIVLRVATASALAAIALVCALLVPLVLIWPGALLAANQAWEDLRIARRTRKELADIRKKSRQPA